MALGAPARVAAASGDGAVTVTGPESDAEALSAQAAEKFKNKEYDEAIALFERAYAASGEPNLLFNIGRVYEEKGDLEKAVEHYERFVREPGVKLDHREAANERLKVLRDIVKKDEPAPVEPKPEPEPEPEPDKGDDERRKPSGMAIGGYVLIGVGVVSLAIGGSLGGVALGRSKDLDSQDGYEARQETVSSGKNLAIGADVGLFLGGALVVTGVVLAVVAAKRAKKGDSGGRTAFTPTFGTTGGGLAVTHRF